MTSVLTRLSQSEAELIYFSLPSPYIVKTVFDHFPTNLFFSFTFYVKIQIVSFHQLISFSFIPSCPSFSKLPCGVGIDKTSTTPSYDSILFTDLKFPDTIPVEIRQKIEIVCTQEISDILIAQASSSGEGKAWERGFAYPGNFCEKPRPA